MKVPSVYSCLSNYSYCIKEKKCALERRESNFKYPHSNRILEYIRPDVYGITFGYHHPIKTMWLKGKLPWLQYGFYGEKLTKRNVSIEHLKPVATFKEECNGNREKARRLATTWENVVLASNRINNFRGCDPLSAVIDYEAMGKYLQQFEGKYIPGFGSGEKYIKGILDTVNTLIQKDL